MDRIKSAKQTEYQRRWRARHAEKQRQYTRQYYWRNRDKYIAYARKYVNPAPTLCDVICNELLDLRRHLHDFCEGGDPAEDVLEYLDNRDYFCKSDCGTDDPTNDSCLKCARERLNAEVER